MSKAPWLPRSGRWLSSRKGRWAVPSGAVAAVAVVAAGSVLTSASAAPSLAPRTPAQLIADIAATKAWPSALSGTVTTSASLGLPSLPGLSGAAPGSPIPSVLTGTHTFQIWYGGPGKLRVAVPVPLGETDLRVDGSSVWLWDSKTNTATHFTQPSGAGRVQPQVGLHHGWSGTPPNSTPPAASASAQFSQPAAGRHQQLTRSQEVEGSASSAYSSTLTVNLGEPTPQQIARQFLAAVGPTTTIAVADNVMVAGRPAYQLTLAPKSTQSLVGQVAIAIDARTHLPLRVQVTARGSATPVFSAGYTAISFATPAASNFSFTPPPGAKVKQATLGGTGSPLGGLLGGSPFGGSPFGSGPPRVRIPSSGKPDKLCSPAGAPTTQHCIVLPPGSKLPKGFRVAKPLGDPGTAQIGVPPGPKGLPIGRGAPELGQARLGMKHSRNLGWYAFGPGGRPVAGPEGSAQGQGQVIGTGWTAVRVFAAPGLAGSAGAQLTGPLKALLNAATPVHGSWGSGHLLRTSLLSVLITSKGQVLIGAVTPDLLYTDVARAGPVSAVTSF
jgi:outer membrane lipoprotein-sorting protein